MDFKAWKPLAFCLAVACAGQAGAQSAERVAAHNDWSVFVASSPKECYIVSQPTSSVARRGGSVVEVQRGDIRLFVAFRPDDSVTNEVSFSAGYPLADTVGMTIGADTFQLVPGEGDGNQWAWTAPADDSRAVAAMRRGVTASIKGTSTRGTDTEDTFSLSGFTAAVEDAAARCR
jgi:invasion protein IalB